jgi:starvation-inducible outer membrane lipoprotein
MQSEAVSIRLACISLPIKQLELTTCSTVPEKLKIAQPTKAHEYVRQEAANDSPIPITFTLQFGLCK